MNSYYLYYFSCFIVFFNNCSGFRQQSVAIGGRLTCYGKPATGIRIDLMESDNNEGSRAWIDHDDFISVGYTNFEGYYNLSGTTSEITSIEPYISIFHNCADENTDMCKRVFRLNIPKTYITWGTELLRVFDAGTFELSKKVTGERRSCLYRNN